MDWICVRFLSWAKLKSVLEVPFGSWRIFIWHEVETGRKRFVAKSGDSRSCADIKIMLKVANIL
jgi:hypothetical protein